MKRSTFFATITMVTLVMIGGVATAQSSWMTSKAVNKVANPDLFANAELTSTHIVASSSNAPLMVSQKGVSRVMLKARGAQSNGNIVSRGTPSWAMSKGVSQLGGTTKKYDSKRTIDETQPMIPIEKKEINRE